MNRSNYQIETGSTLKHPLISDNCAFTNFLHCSISARSTASFHGRLAHVSNDGRVEHKTYYNTANTNTKSYNLGQVILGSNNSTLATIHLFLQKSCSL